MKGQQGKKPAAPSIDSLPTGAPLKHYDGRKAFARAIKARRSQYIADMGGQASSMEVALLDRRLFIEGWCEMFEAAVAEGRITSNDTEKLQAYLKAVNTLLSLGKAVGLRRRPKDVPDLNSYVQQKYGNGKASSS